MVSADMLGNDESQETLGLFLSSGGGDKTGGWRNKKKGSLLYCHEIKYP